MCFKTNCALIRQMRNAIQHFLTIYTEGGRVVLWNKLPNKTGETDGDINFVLEMDNADFEKSARLSVTFMSELTLRILRDILTALAASLRVGNPTFSRVPPPIEMEDTVKDMLNVPENNKGLCGIAAMQPPDARRLRRKFAI